MTPQMQILELKPGSTQTLEFLIENKIIKRITVTQKYNSMGFLQKLELIFYPSFRIYPRIMKILPDQFENLEELNYLLEKKFKKCIKFFKLEKIRLEEKARQLTLELTP